MAHPVRDVMCYLQALTNPITAEVTAKHSTNAVEAVWHPMVGLYN